MTMNQVPSNVEEIRLSAVILRADGRVEELGEVSYYHKNPLRRWAWTMKRKVKAWRSA